MAAVATFGHMRHGQEGAVQGDERNIETPGPDILRIGILRRCHYIERTDRGLADLRCVDSLLLQRLSLGKGRVVCIIASTVFTQ